MCACSVSESILEEFHCTYKMQMYIKYGGLQIIYIENGTYMGLYKDVY